MSRIFDCNDNFLDELTPQSAWFLGIMASDGNISGTNRFSISQSGDHGFDMIKHIQALLHHNGNVCTTKTNRLDAHSIAITSPKLVSKMAEYGIGPNKSLTLKFPYNIPIELRRDFIRGYFEGDGSIGVYHLGNTPKCLVISMYGTVEFIRGVSENVPLRHCVNDGGHEFRCNSRYAVRVGDWLFANPDLYVGRKVQMWMEHKIGFQNAVDDAEALRGKMKEIYEHSPLPTMEVAKLNDVNFQNLFQWIKKYGWKKKVSYMYKGKMITPMPD